MCIGYADLPDVIDARGRVALPDPPAATEEQCYSYRTMATDAYKEEWLREIPADRKSLVIMEGLVVYLPTNDGECLIKRLATNFAPKGGEMLFEGTSPTAVKMLNWQLKRKNQFLVQFDFAIGHPKDVEKLHSGLKLLGHHTLMSKPALTHLSFGQRILAFILNMIPYFRSFSRYMRFKMQGVDKSGPQQAAAAT